MGRREDSEKLLLRKALTLIERKAFRCTDERQKGQFASGHGPGQGRAGGRATSRPSGSRAGGQAESRAAARQAGRQAGGRAPQLVLGGGKVPTVRAAADGRAAGGRPGSRGGGAGGGRLTASKPRLSSPLLVLIVWFSSVWF